MPRGGRVPGAKNKDKGEFERVWRRIARKHGVNENEVLAELCKDPSPTIRLGAVKLIIFMLHARPVQLPAPIVSDAQLSFLPAEPAPQTDRYDGQTIQ